MLKSCHILMMAVAIPVCPGLWAAECIAHRGDSIRHADNTVEAIESAWGVGADGVEVDVRMCAEGALVLFHDPKCQGVAVSGMTHAELDAATPNQRVPTLVECLKAGRSGKSILLDLKEGSDVYLRKVIEAVKDSTPVGCKVMLQSTSLEVLKFLRENAPKETELFYVTELSARGTPSEGVEIATKLVAQGLQGISAKGRQFVNAEFVAAFRQRGLKYYVWTINEQERIAHYMGLGVQGVITDDPVTFRKACADL